MYRTEKKSVLVVFARQVCFIKLQFLDNNLDYSGTMR